MINSILSSIYSGTTLFSEQQKKTLVRGGVVDEEAYISGKPRLVFVLKDPGVTRGWSWPREMREQIKRIEEHGTFCGDAGWQKTARPLGIWSYSIRNGFPVYKQVSSNLKSAEGLGFCGMTNLKKTPGESNISNRSEVEREAQRTSSLLSQELNTMAPDIVICCGRHWVYDLLISILGLPEQNAYVQASGERFFYSLGRLSGGKETIVVDFYHPQYRGKKQAEIYTVLRRVFRELKRRGLLPD